jgi:hypothetical protein
MDPASEKQVRYAQGLNVVFQLPISKTKLSELIDKANQAQGQGQQQNNYGNNNGYPRSNYGSNNNYNNGFKKQ